MVFVCISRSTASETGLRVYADVTAPGTSTTSLSLFLEVFFFFLSATFLRGLSTALSPLPQRLRSLRSFLVSFSVCSSSQCPVGTAFCFLLFLLSVPPSPLTRLSRLLPLSCGFDLPFLFFFFFISSALVCPGLEESHRWRGPRGGEEASGDFLRNMKPFSSRCPDTSRLVLSLLLSLFFSFSLPLFFSAAFFLLGLLSLPPSLSTWTDLSLGLDASVYISLSKAICGAKAATSRLEHLLSVRLLHGSVSLFLPLPLSPRERIAASKKQKITEEKKQQGEGKEVSVCLSLNLFVSGLVGVVMVLTARQIERPPLRSHAT